MFYKAYAKINLSLDILRKRKDGYHELKMIMQTVSLCDEIYIEKSDTVSIECNKDDIPLNNKNLAWKAADAFFNYTSINSGCKIKLIKHIPDGAGLGGGSSDAATVLLALNEIYNTNITNEELINIAVKIGADVPFFILKGTCLAEGIGEKLTKIENNTDPYILIHKPSFSISTKWAYENLKLDNKNNYNVDKIVENLKDKNYNFKDIFNYLEDVSVSKYPQINDIKNKMKYYGATAALMSGSGSSVFGIFTDKNAAQTAFESFEKNTVFLAKFC